MFKNLTENLKKGGKGSNQKKQTLQMTLVALTMADQGIGSQKIADELGITKYALTFRVFEKKSTFTENGKKVTKCRSIMRYLYEDQHDPNNDNTVDTETFLTRLFNHYGEEYLGGEAGELQVQEILDDWAENKSDSQQDNQQEIAEDDQEDIEDQEHDNVS